MIPTINQIKVYNFASNPNPQNTSNTKTNVTAGNTGASNHMTGDINLLTKIMGK